MNIVREEELVAIIRLLKTQNKRMQLLEKKLTNIEAAVVISVPNEGDS